MNARLESSLHGMLVQGSMSNADPDNRHRRLRSAGIGRVPKSYAGSGAGSRSVQPHRGRFLPIPNFRLCAMISTLGMRVIFFQPNRSFGRKKKANKFQSVGTIYRRIFTILESVSPYGFGIFFKFLEKLVYVTKYQLVVGGVSPTGSLGLLPYFGEEFFRYGSANILF